MSTVLPFPQRGDGPDYVTFPIRIHQGDETGPVIARFTHADPDLLKALATRRDLIAVDIRTGRVVAVDGPILGQLQLDPTTL